MRHLYISNTRSNPAERSVSGVQSSAYVIFLDELRTTRKARHIFQRNLKVVFYWEQPFFGWLGFFVFY